MNKKRKYLRWLVQVLALVCASTCVCLCKYLRENGVDITNIVYSSSVALRMIDVAPMVNKVPSSITLRSLSPRISLSTNVPV